MADEVRGGDLPLPAPSDLPLPREADGWRTAVRVAIGTLVWGLALSLALVGGLVYSSGGFDWLSIATVEEFFGSDAEPPTAAPEDLGPWDLNRALAELRQARAEAVQDLNRALAELRQARGEAVQDLNRALAELRQARGEARALSENVGELVELVEHYDNSAVEAALLVDLLIGVAGAGAELAAAEEALREEHAARTEAGLPLDLPVEGLTHPEVQEQARAVIDDVVSLHEQRWPWGWCRWARTRHIITGEPDVHLM